MSTVEIQEPAYNDNFLAERMKSVLLGAARPMTIRDIAGQFGRMPGYRIVHTLNDLTANGGLARFRAGLSQYYATPRNAFTGENLPLRTVVTDSLKSLLPSR